MSEVKSKFSGQATIKIRFRNQAEYNKFRLYVLKTNWRIDVAPIWEDIVVDFHNSDDIDQINRKVIQLLQLGFEVYCCRFKLEEQLAEEQYPEEADSDDEYIYEEGLADVFATKTLPKVEE